MKVRVETDDHLTMPSLTLHVPSDYPNLDELVAALAKVPAVPVTLLVSQRGQAMRLPLATIMFIEATGHQVAVHTRTGVFRVNKSLTALEHQLPAPFQRVSKSALVNTDQIYALTKTLTGNLLTFNQSPKQLYASRRYYRAIKLILEQKEF
ncbi:LytTR family DNA-binding domain-containing protein [Lactiplantibacillus carotarum]|uniref:LytTR family DNA-binding domain-containing protein n=1 Tax=Lactiplantibacillus carotarum TaxID=2993456 RepID=UPI00298ED0F7|nr:LytTR family DNA-binding domain-containing protein [Lactiplantibacillus carotarum]